MPQMSGGDAVVQALIAHGIKSIYCLPGIQSDHLFNALFDVGDALNVIHTRHEQGAAYMALGAALATGKPQVYSVVPGPGLLNSTAALATAYSTSAPVLALSGQIPSKFIGKGHRPAARDPRPARHPEDADQMGDAHREAAGCARAGGAGVPAHDARAHAAGRPRDRAGHSAGARRDRARGAAAAACRSRSTRTRSNAPRSCSEKAERPLIFLGGGALDAGPR